MKVSLTVYIVFFFDIFKATYNHTKELVGMMGDIDGAQLMRLLMRLVKARKVIEIGKVNLM